MKSQSSKLFMRLGSLQVFIGIGAIPAGVMFIIDPSGEALGMSVTMIETSPFQSYLLPGFILLLIHGIGSLTGGVLSFSKSRVAAYIGIALGITLIIWIIAQVYWMGLSSWLQLLMFLFGTVEILLAKALLKKVKGAQ
ncbi:hypothetical protein QA612_20215 [Evansella sp. AB-P1]|uniref:hypothetical protein n=1 Tax=Evansella sp. AB-P1 TaxID=3037653 RepID=UPI00241DA770|nr:hypothetical protein [Evansella sp. AB-P1]MDG5789787.1 hypothetical protein [Evansella sp. AB-P1]